MNQYWISVLIAGLFEVLWVTGLKVSNNWISWVLTIIAIYISFHMLIRSTKRLPVSTVYAVFTSIGTAGTVLVETAFFGEPFSWTKSFFILVLLIGVFGLKLVTKDNLDEKRSCSLMGWVYLILAGMFEVVGVTGMNKLSKNRNLQAVIILLGGMILSFGFLNQAMKTLPMGISYAVWTGIGTVGGTLVGMLFYGESNDWKRILFISMILMAVIGLKVTS